MCEKWVQTTHLENAQGPLFFPKKNFGWKNSPTSNSKIVFKIEDNLQFWRFLFLAISLWFSFLSVSSNLSSSISKIIFEFECPQNWRSSDLKIFFIFEEVIFIFEDRYKMVYQCVCGELAWLAVMYWDILNV